MKFLKNNLRFSLTLIIPALALFFMSFAHEFYVSISQCELNTKSKRVEIAAKVFTDDLIAAVENGTTKKLYLGEDREISEAENLVKTYFQKHYALTVNDSINTPLNILGFEHDIDVTWVYIESDSIVNNISSVEIFCDILTDILPKQTNIIKFKALGTNQSMILDKSETEASFKLNE